MTDPNQGGDIVAVQDQLPRPQQEIIPVKQIVARKQQIQQAMKSVMVEDVHYGVIPGTKKNTLLKPGADLLMSMFQIAAIPKVKDLCQPDMDEVHIRVTLEGISQITGQVVGAGVGEASTYEKKYRWRRAVGPEYENALATERNINYVPKNWKDPEGACWENKQVRMEVGDISNTILKMAKKRALADFVQTALAVSDLFGEGESDNNGQPQQQQRPAKQARPPVNDIPPELDEQVTTPPAADDKLTDQQAGLLLSQCDRAGVAEQLVCDQYGVASIKDLTFSQFNDVSKWVRENAQSAT